MIAADRERVSVPRCHPDFQVGTNGFETGRHRRRAAVNGVEAISVHVIRKTAGAADSGNDDEVFAPDAEFRKNGLHRGENRVVSAARAPTHFLVGLKVFFRER